MTGFRAERFHWSDDCELDWHVRKPARDAYEEPEHPRAFGGKWTTKGKESPYARWEHEHPSAGSELLNKIKAEGGFTYHVMNEDSPKQGYVLSPYKNREQVIDVSRLTPQDLAHYAVKNGDLLARGDHYFGGWHNKDDGKVYLDVSIVSKTPQEAEKLSQEYHQLAYFDLGKQETINVTRH